MALRREYVAWSFIFNKLYTEHNVSHTIYYEAYLFTFQEPQESYSSNHRIFYHHHRYGIHDVG